MVPYNSNVVAFVPWLKGHGANATSQFGEDGLVEACLEHFGTTNRWCFEVGASDGLALSNTHRLRCAGWSAVLIESDPFAFGRLCDQRSDKVACIHETIGPESLDRILADNGCPVDLDFGSLDIDGQDWWCWDGMKRFRPRLMLVEFEYLSEGHAPSVPKLGGPGQANYKAIEQLGISKGYTPLAKTNVNLLFCKTELL